MHIYMYVHVHCTCICHRLVLDAISGGGGGVTNMFTNFISHTYFHFTGMYSVHTHLPSFDSYMYMFSVLLALQADCPQHCCRVHSAHNEDHRPPTISQSQAGPRLQQGSLCRLCCRSDQVPLVPGLYHSNLPGPGQLMNMYVHMHFGKKMHLRSRISH